MYFGGGGLVTKSCLILEISWTVAHQASLSIPCRNTGVGLPFLSPGDLPNPEIKLVSPALAGRFFTTAPPGKPGKEDIRYKLRKSEYFMNFNNNILILADEL